MSEEEIWFICILTVLQQRYQREIDKLERDNRELRKQVIILKGDSMPAPRKIKVRGSHEVNDHHGLFLELEYMHEGTVGSLRRF